MKHLVQTSVLSVALVAMGCSSASTPSGDSDGATPGDGGSGAHDGGHLGDAHVADGGTTTSDGSSHLQDGGGLADGSTPHDANAQGEGSVGHDGGVVAHDGGSSTDSGGATGLPACSTGCTSAPASTCRDSNTLETYGSSIGCVDELCRYTTTEVACPYGCAAGACASATACTAGALRCSGAGVEVCNATGSAWLFEQICPSTCTAGLCDAPCTAGTTRCDGNIPQTCSSDGTAWQSGTACTTACEAGACLQATLVVDGTTLVLDGLQAFSQSVVVKNGGTIQVGSSGSLTLSAPTIDVGPGSSITGASSGACPSAWAPDDVSQGIRLVSPSVTVDGSVTWTGNTCATKGIVVRGGAIAGSGTVSVTSSGRALLLYGTGGVATTLVATGAKKSLMPPTVIASAPYPAGGTYNDDGPPASFTWDKPFATVAGYYYVVSGASSVPTASSTLISGEALASAVPAPPVTYIDVVTLDTSGTIGTVPHELAITINTKPPALASSTNPTPGTYVTNADAVISWSGGNAPNGYLSVLDRFPTTHPEPSTSTPEPASLSPAQVLLQNLSPGQQWFHLVGQDVLGYRTKAASHWELDVGATPTMATDGVIAGTVVDVTNTPIVGATVSLQRGVAVQTTTTGGVYTFQATVPAGTYEVVASAAGMQSEALTLTVTAGATTDGDFQLSAGTGCPTCADPCAAKTCTKADPCADGLSNPWAGTCDQGACATTAIDDVACQAPSGSACTINAECASGYCSSGNVCYDGATGSACTANSQCAAGYCTNSLCGSGANGIACSGNTQCAGGACVYEDDLDGYECRAAACAALGTNPCYNCCYPNYCMQKNGYLYCEQ